MIERVSGRQAFARFRAEGRRLSAGDLWCVVIEDDDLPAGRIAYAIGRPVGGAVVRNQIRRRLRHAAAAHADEWRPGWYLIGVRPNAATRSYQELDAMLQQLLNRMSREHR